MSAGGEHTYTNRLAQQESPYLLQHAHNPVDWYPWGPEAIERAQREDRPIFLSVGYSTCHWCHVMERESFESAEIADTMNRHFVNVKVDREERPEVDRIYMSFVQATTGGGGWPMSVFLTPSLEPFFGGTYFPPTDSFGRPGFRTVLERVAHIWETRKADVKAQGSDIMRQLQEFTAPAKPSAEALTAAAQGAALDSCAAQLARRFDARLGGFGGAPKFPRPAELNSLFAQHSRLVAGGDNEGAREVLRQALFSMERMAAGGMWDHVGGGFHRYSVDECWHVPHFEKMTYDNPQLASTYLSAVQLTTGEEARQLGLAARGILDYLLRDMCHPEGGFYAAEDADSLDPATRRKKEGWFYVWTADEIASVLGEERARVFNAHYYIKPEGNCDLSPRSDPHGEFGGLNVLIARQPLAETTTLAGRSEAETEALLAECREALFRVREKRPRPHRDDKIVTAWQGMAISALAMASRVLAFEGSSPRLFPVGGGSPRKYLDAALACAAFARSKLWDEGSRRLCRTFTRGPSDVLGFSDDYALLIAGLLDLYSATGDHRHLEWAQQLQEIMDELFWDDVGGGYFLSAAGDESIRLRMKEDYDGAEPAASSIAAANLWRLAGHAGTEEAQQLMQRAQKCAAAFEEQLKRAALAMPQMCCAVHLLSVGHPRQVIIAGRRGAPDTEALVDAAFAAFAPDKVIIHLDLANEAELAWWRAHNPEAVVVVEATGMTSADVATAFICQNFTCQAPTTDPAKVRELLCRPRTALSARPKLTPVHLPGSL